MQSSGAALAGFVHAHRFAHLAGKDEIGAKGALGLHST
jgi:hypothetical protein